MFPTDIDRFSLAHQPVTASTISLVLSATLALLLGCPNFRVTVLDDVSIICRGINMIPTAAALVPWWKGCSGSARRILRRPLITPGKLTDAPEHCRQPPGRTVCARSQHRSTRPSGAPAPHWRLAAVRHVCSRAQDVPPEDAPAPAYSVSPPNAARAAPYPTAADGSRPDCTAGGALSGLARGLPACRCAKSGL
ncbi:hypothetical protein [Puniceibacterium confluentis]|uniref:hypothetical protein n=1 Tax=Puniceibacterium confluentis TaxID=1958944 RepID=UPI001644689A|nr:hypothetical protein [Puniceibacterium confluentis]